MSAKMSHAQGELTEDNEMRMNRRGRTGILTGLVGVMWKRKRGSESERERSSS